jgi:hypothetical protein
MSTGAQARQIASGSGQVMTLHVLPMSALERALRWITELANRRGDSFTQLDVQAHGSKPILV